MAYNDFDYSCMGLQTSRAQQPQSFTNFGVLTHKISRIFSQFSNEQCRPTWVSHDRPTVEQNHAFNVLTTSRLQTFEVRGTYAGCSHVQTHVKIVVRDATYFIWGRWSTTVPCTPRPTT